MGGYAFRGIEDITAAAQGLLGRYGVITVPELVGQRVVNPISVGGKPWTETILRVRYVFMHGPSDTQITVGGDEGLIGVGWDNTDKGVNKAMSQAFKVALLQTLMVGDKSLDVDGNTPIAGRDVDEGEAQRQPEWWELNGYESVEEYEQHKTQTGAAMAQLASEHAETMRTWLHDHGVVNRSGEPRRWPMPLDVAERLYEFVRELVLQDDGEIAPVREEPTARESHLTSGCEHDETGRCALCDPDRTVANPDVDTVLDDSDIAEGSELDGPPAVDPLRQMLEDAHARADGDAELEAARAFAAQQADGAELRKAPSIEQLDKMGATPDDIEAGIEFASAHSLGELSAALAERHVTLGGSEDDRRQRLAKLRAAELVEQRAAARDESAAALEGSE